MAHRTDVVQVLNKIETSFPSYEAVDPVCGIKFQTSDALHMLFHGDATYYFCSKECEKRFTDQILNKEKMIKI